MTATAAAATMAAMPTPNRRPATAETGDGGGALGAEGFMAITGARSSGGGTSSREAEILSHRPGGGLDQPGLSSPATSRCSATSARQGGHPRTWASTAWCSTGSRASRA